LDESIKKVAIESPLLLQGSELYALTVVITVARMSFNLKITGISSSENAFIEAMEVIEKQGLEKQLRSEVGKIYPTNSGRDVASLSKEEVERLTGLIISHSGEQPTENL